MNECILRAVGARYLLQIDEQEAEQLLKEKMSYQYIYMKPFYEKLEEYERIATNIQRLRISNLYSLHR